MQQSNQGVPSENFDAIELDEQEIEEALRKAREEKYYMLKRIEYNQKLSAVYNPKRYTVQEVLNEFAKQFTVDWENEEIVRNLCQYFTETAGALNLDKGLLLVGGVGIGKSTLMNFFRRNQKASYRMISCREIESDFSSEGERSVKNCSYNLQIAVNSDPFGHQELGYCFDDLGTEANAKHYGKEKNVMAEIILNRYDNHLPYHFTHITTNLTAEDLKLQYGTRVTDRMREMFNIITFPTNSKSRRA